ncbi:heptahelical transmembrane protein ADIPOR1 isoform X3 [Amborella trichopoda]|uniref:heptahelical transmembrane protein ADIPOR1 isoform X3 n=1 Tax=Amborella trichopoda TaxID=13333 RepID=UPI0005D42C20|nr:heptahelical transmembrane protein ADIPOR1 isoform X3 [Amborella trichopoda]|eukprot:XP_011626411.1 heptahelical transmembrane protein ADIPOR1 isoform X3 [Amborella trichopoda]
MEEKKEGRKCKKKNLGLVNYEELPNYMKDNEYILHYYRVEWPLKEAFLSVFSWHNETLNVWTHFGGFFLFLGLTIMHLVEMPGVLELLSRIFWPLLLTSSKASYKFGNSTMVLYLSAISVMGILVVVTLLSPELSSPAFRKLRAMLFLAMGFSGIIPAVHALVVNWNEPLRFITLAYELAMAFFYGTGTFFYVSRVPEKWKPGSFDMAGHSHQIFHVFVVAGAIAHYDAAMIFLKWRDTVGCNQFQ